MWKYWKGGGQVGGWVGRLGGWVGERVSGCMGVWVGHTSADAISPLPDLIANRIQSPSTRTPSRSIPHTTPITAASCRPSGPSPHLSPSPTPPTSLALYSIAM